ncbi:MAG: hypothetical protein KUG81_06520 [Gammaproteobacteria bacterium]|nr:hypothetical protein [Gammaproteobacteria bacterium]
MRENYTIEAHDAKQFKVLEDTIKGLIKTTREQVERVTESEVGLISIFMKDIAPEQEYVLPQHPMTINVNREEVAKFNYGSIVFIINNINSTKIKFRPKHI